jgi:hypothetical protein
MAAVAPGGPAGAVGTTSGGTSDEAPRGSAGVEAATVADDPAELLDRLAAPHCTTPLCLLQSVSAPPARREVFLAAAVPLLLGGLAVLGALGIRPRA